MWSRPTLYIKCLETTLLWFDTVWTKLTWLYCSKTDTNIYSPVLMELGCASRYVGKVKPKNIENPRTKRFLDEFKSTSCRLDRPTAVIIPEKKKKSTNHDYVMVWLTDHITGDCDSPKSVQNIPPRIGSGSEANRAVNFPTEPSRNIMPAPYCTTRLLPTCTQVQWFQHPSKEDITNAGLSPVTGHMITK